MFRRKPRETVDTRTPAVTGISWPVFSANYTATSGDLPNMNVSVTHQHPGILTVHLGLALNPPGWFIETVTPYHQPGIETAADGPRVYSLNLELRRMGSAEQAAVNARRKRASVFETSTHDSEENLTDSGKPQLEFVTMHLHSQSAAPCGYQEGRNWIDKEGRFNLTLISKELMPSQPRFQTSVKVREETQIDVELPGEERPRNDEERWNR